MCLRHTRVYISGMGVVTALGKEVADTLDALKKGIVGIQYHDLYSLSENRLIPIAICDDLKPAQALPRSHQLARYAGKKAMEGCQRPPDAIVLGVTTGGMSTTERYIKEDSENPENYSYHSLNSIVEDLAEQFSCEGPLITISNACASSATALKLATQMIRSGEFHSILVGGVDALCDLTVFGFHSLQLVDLEMGRPLDIHRHGLSLGEGAAMMQLTADRGNDFSIEILGGGLSCDAHHPTAPHPEGKGAFQAMKRALLDAGVDASEVDYINLHGTGTIDNDLSESKAIHALFSNKIPSLSSVKGATGHTLGASGAVEALISAASMENGFLPASIGCEKVDPALGLDPIKNAIEKETRITLSNTFGFGGNNAAIILGKADSPVKKRVCKTLLPMKIVSYAALTGKGDLSKSFDLLNSGVDLKGRYAEDEIIKEIPPSWVRRVKRLSRMSLNLALTLHGRVDSELKPSAVFLGTGWGALSETYDFLSRLFETTYRFPSPMDFIGSVHNSPAGLIATHFKADGANVTTSGGDYSFEQALFTANFLAQGDDEHFMVLGVDEAHPVLSKRLDPSMTLDASPSDGGAGFCVSRLPGLSGVTIEPSFFSNACSSNRSMNSLISQLGGKEHINETYDVIFAGMPKASEAINQEQLSCFITQTGFKKRVVDYRQWLGEYASASAVATALAVRCVERGYLPKAFAEKGQNGHYSKNILVLGFGKAISAIKVSAP